MPRERAIWSRDRDVASGRGAVRVLFGCALLGVAYAALAGAIYGVVFYHRALVAFVGGWHWVGNVDYWRMVPRVVVEVGWIGARYGALGGLFAGLVGGSAICLGGPGAGGVLGWGVGGVIGAVEASGACWGLGRPLDPYAAVIGGLVGLTIGLSIRRGTSRLPGVNRLIAVIRAARGEE